MGEIHMDVVHDVLRALKIVARDHLHRRRNRPALVSAVFQAGQRSKGRRLAFPEIGKNEAVSLVRRIRGQSSHARAERLRLGGLLDTLPGLVVAPAVIAEANGVAFDPSRRQASQAMRALVDYGASGSTLAPVE